MVQITAYPVFVLHFSGTPTGTAATGTYGYDDTNKIPYIYDGTSWNALPTSTSVSARQLGQMSIEILRLDANASVVGTGYTDELLEIYSDSNGYNNYINTSSTTALFSTNLYNNSNGTGTGATDSGSASNATEGGITQKAGYKMVNHAGSRKLTKITKHATCTATTAYLYASNGTTLLATASFSTDDATFDYSLTASATYYVLLDSGGAAYTRAYNSGAPAYPYNGTNIDFTTGYWNGGDGAGDAIGISSVTTNALVNENRIVQMSAQTLSITPTAFQITGYAEAATGTGSVTYDVSFDNGSHYQTAIAAGTRTVITNTGTSLIVKQNLNAGASAGAAEAKGFAVQFS